MAGALRELLAVFTIDVEDKKLKEAESSIEHFFEGVKKALPALAGGFIAAELSHVAHSLSEVGHNIEINALRLGIGTDSFQALGFAAEEAGVSANTLTLAMLQLENRVGDALKDKTGANAKAFKRLGVTLRDANGEVKDSDVILSEVADGLSKMKSPAEKTNALFATFGRQGRLLLPVLSGGAAGLAAMKKEFGELGGGFSHRAIEASKDYHAALVKQSALTTSISGVIAERFLPVMKKAVDFVTKIGIVFLEWLKKSRIIEVALVALGVTMAVLAVKAAILAAPLLAIVAAIAFLALAVEDLVVFMEGGDSVIGDFVEGLLGLKGKEQTIKDLKQTWQDLYGFIKLSWEYLKKFLEKLDEGSNAIAKFVGMNIASVSESNPAVQRQRIREQSFLHGGGGATFPGETPEQASAANAAARESANQTAGALAFTPLPSGRDTYNNVTVQVDGGNTENVKTAVREVINEETSKARGNVVGHSEARGRQGR